MRLISPLLFLLAVVAQGQTNETVVSHFGYIVDVYCWKRPEHRAIDTGDPLDLFPERHTVHCLRDISRCYESGFYIMEPMVGQDLHQIKYKLDTSGDALAFDLIKSTSVVRGLQLTVTGTVDESNIDSDGIQIINVLSVSDASRTLIINTLVIQFMIVGILFWLN